MGILKGCFCNKHRKVKNQEKHDCWVMMLFHIAHDSNMFYPLVNVYKKRWKITMLLVGKLTISTGPFQ
jgi:hypothetical protein